MVTKYWYWYSTVTIAMTMTVYIPPSDRWMRAERHILLERMMQSRGSAGTSEGSRDMRVVIPDGGLLLSRVYRGSYCEYS